MNEAEFKTNMVKQVQSELGYGRRFEDQFAVGIFDMILIPHGGPTFFIEAKISRGIYRPRPRQLVELNRIQNAEGGAVVILMGCNPDNHNVYLNPLGPEAHNKNARVSGHWKEITKLLKAYHGQGHT
jgi:hypothetical protein